MKFKVIAQCEISRTNITPKAFFGYCKREIERRTGGKLHLNDWLDSFGDWENPACKSEYHMEKHEDWGKDARREVIKVQPFNVQWYLEGSYNFIMEFDFYDEKTGFGYLYMVEMEEETETTETEPEQAESKEEKTMMNYNYPETMSADVLDYIADNITRTDWTDDRDGLESQLYDDCFIADSVTGNASGSYFCNAWKAREAVIDNMDLCTESLKEFCVEAASIATHFLNEDWEYFDVTIRCYLLGQAISEVLDLLEESGYFEESETDESDIIKAVSEQLTA